MFSTFVGGSINFWKYNLDLFFLLVFSLSFFFFPHLKRELILGFFLQRRFMAWLPVFLFLFPQKSYRRDSERNSGSFENRGSVYERNLVKNSYSPDTRPPALDKIKYNKRPGEGRVRDLGIPKSLGQLSWAL